MDQPGEPHRKLFWILAGGVLLLGIAIGLELVPRLSRERTPPKPRRLPFENLRLRQERPDVLGEDRVRRLSYQGLIDILSSKGSNPLARSFAQEFLVDADLKRTWEDYERTHDLEAFAKALRSSAAFARLLEKYRDRPGFKELAQDIAGQVPLARFAAGSEAETLFGGSGILGRKGRAGRAETPGRPGRSAGTSFSNAEDEFRYVTDPSLHWIGVNLFRADFAALAYGLDAEERERLSQALARAGKDGSAYDACRQAGVLEECVRMVQKCMGLQSCTDQLAGGGKSLCRNRRCDEGETCETCPDDCGRCAQPPTCGDGNCSLSDNESCTNCVADCCPCGDTRCTAPMETCGTCPGDCGSCPCVSDSSCSAPAPACGQTTTGVDNCNRPCQRTGPTCPCVPNGSCSASAPPCGQTYSGVDNCGRTCQRPGPACPPVCDGPTPPATAPACESPQESCATCPADCGACPYCGDGDCAGSETNQSCSRDCPPRCGDGYCTPYVEGWQNCRQDCPCDCTDWEQGGCSGNCMEYYRACTPSACAVEWTCWNDGQCQGQDPFAF